MSRQETRSSWISVLWAAGIILFAGLPGFAQFEPMNDVQMVAASAHIVVATVESAQARWNDRHNLIVTDYALRVEDRLRGEAPAELRITMAGGTLDGETHQTSVSTPLQTGARYLLFLGDLKQPVFNPVVGGWQGVFREMRGEDGIGYAAAGDSTEPLRREGRGVEFSAFVAATRSRVLQLQTAPKPEGARRSTAEERAALPVKEFDPSALRGHLGDAVLPLTETRLQPQPALFPQNEAGEIAGAVASASLDSLLSVADPYVYKPQPARPIVFNPFPHSFTISPHDQYMMGVWNKYADLYRVYANPTGTWAWRNGVFDLAGFPPDSQMLSQFGQAWPAGVLGITFTRTSGGPIVEADIALNPAYSWTLDERAASSPGGLNSFHHTLLHELGHSWGLQHPWETQNVWWDSVMNYAPAAYRLATLQTDDTTAIHRAYPGIFIHDGILSGYRTRDDPASNNPIYVASKPIPTTLVAGKSFSLSSSIKIENGGTDNIVNPAVEVYLVPQRMSWAGAIYLKTLKYTTTIRPFYTNYLSLGSIKVPTSVPSRTYYIGYFVRDSLDGNQDNNSAWSDWNGTLRVTH